MPLMQTSKPAKAILNLVVAGLVATFVAGCAWSIGGTKESEHRVQPTKGQELLDLKRANDAGALTDAEYEAQRQRVLNR